MRSKQSDLAAYRAYLVDQAGHFHGVRPLDGCTSDDEAIAMAKRYVDGCAVELWDRARLVAKIVKKQGITRVEHPDTE